MAQGLDILALEDTLHAFVVEQSGLPGNRVIWGNQGKPRPDTEPFIVLEITSNVRIGRDESHEVRDRYTLSVNTIAAATLYRITINGTNFDFTSDSNPTEQEIITGLVTALGEIGKDNGDGTFQFELTGGGSDTMTISANLTQDDQGGVRTVAGPRSITLQIEGIGDGARQLLTDVRDLTHVTSVLDDLHAKNVKFRADFGVQNAPATLEAEHEEDATLDLVFGVEMKLEETIDIIETVNYDYTVDGPDEQPALAESRTVP